MTEPERQHLKGLPDRRVEPESPVEVSTRVLSIDYGRGTVVAHLPTGVQIMWDKPMLKGAVGPQMLTHSESFVARLERLPEGS